MLQQLSWYQNANPFYTPKFDTKFGQTIYRTSFLHMYKKSKKLQIVSIKKIK